MQGAKTAVLSVIFAKLIKHREKVLASHSIDIDIFRRNGIAFDSMRSPKILSPTDIDELGKLNVCREKQTYYEMQAENMQKRLK